MRKDKSEKGSGQQVGPCGQQVGHCSQQVGPGGQQVGLGGQQIGPGVAVNKSDLLVNTVQMPARGGGIRVIFILYIPSVTNNIRLIDQNV